MRRLWGHLSRRRAGAGGPLAGGTAVDNFAIAMVFGIVVGASSSIFIAAREDVVGRACVWTEGRRVRLEYSVALSGWTVDFADVLALRGNVG